MNKTEEAVFTWLQEHDSGTSRIIANSLQVSFQYVSKILSEWQKQGKVFLIHRDKKRNLHYSLKAPPEDITESLKTIPQRIREYLHKRPGSTSTEIAGYLNMRPRSLYSIIGTEVEKNHLERRLSGHVWCYWIKDQEPEKPKVSQAAHDAMSQELTRLIAQAEKLEKHHLWRRAVNVWALALQCKQSDRSERRIRKRRDRAHEQALAKTKYWPGYL